MPIELSLYPNMQYGILVYSNAFNAQKATLKLENDSPRSYSCERGTKRNQLISQPGETFTTGRTGKLTVDIQSSSDGGQWKPSQLKKGTAGFGGGRTPWMWFVGSEDGTDNDYNDCIVIVYTTVD
jgi:hypothetical protein